MVQKTGNQKTTVEAYGNLEVLPEHDEALDDTQESNETHTRRTLEPEPTAETAGEKADTGKLKVKIESKQKGADISLNVLESKVDQGRYYDAESPAEIASINPWEDFDKPREAIEEQKIADAAATFGCALSVLMKIGSLNGLDVSTPKKLIDAVHSGNFPITPNATELTAITKLEEIYSAEGSSWKKAFTEQFWGGLWGQVVSSKETEVRGIPESAIHSPASQASIAAANKAKADSGSLQNVAQNSVQSTPKTAAGVGNWLSQKWDEAKENPGTALLYTGIAAAGIYGLYKIAKYLLKDDGSKDGEKAGEKEEGGMIGKILKYVLGAGAIGGGAYGLFGLFRSLTAGAEGKIVDGAGSKIVDTIKEKLGLDDKHGETVTGLLAKGEIGGAIEAVFNGLDKEKDYHDALAVKIKHEVQGEKLIGKVLYTFKDKNFTDFMDSDPKYSLEFFNDTSNTIMDVFKDIPGASKITGGVYGMDAEDQKSATIELQTYFQKNQKRLDANIPIDKKTTTIGEVLRMLVPIGSPELKNLAPDKKTQSTPPPEPSAQGESKENTGVAIAGGAAAIAATGSISQQIGHESTHGSTIKPQSEVSTPQIETSSGNEVTWSAIKDVLKDESVSSDSKSERNKIILQQPENSPFRKQLKTNEELLDGLPTMAQLHEAIDALEKRAKSLDSLWLKTKNEEEKEPIEEKQREIREYMAVLLKLIPQNEAAAENYLKAMQTGDTETVQKAMTQITMVKGKLGEALHDSLTREGWAFLENQMVMRGIPIAWNFYHNWLHAEDLRQENGKYIFGKFWGTLKSVLGGSTHRLRGTGDVKGPPMELDEIERLTGKFKEDIETLRTDLSETGKGELGDNVDKRFFDKYKKIETDGVLIRTDIERRIKAADEAAAQAMARQDKAAFEAAKSELNRCYKATADIEAGVVHSVEEGWQILHKRFGAEDLGRKPIGYLDILETSINQKGYEGGMQQLRSTMRSVIKNFKKKSEYSLWRSLVPSKTAIGVYGLQLGLGSYLLKDEQTSANEAFWQSAQMAAPGWGTWLDAKQAWTGKESFTGNPLDGTDQFISGAFAAAGGLSDSLTLFGLGFIGRYVLDGAKTVRGLSKLRKAQMALENLGKGYKEYKGSKAFALTGKLHLATAGLAIGVIGTQVIKAGLEKYGEVNLSEGAYNDIVAPLKDGEVN